jgi:molybdenum-dependent DNA-binding transcriptional regulator ModE
VLVTVDEGGRAGVLARFTDRELSLLRDYLRAATELTERHEKRIADGATH